MTKTGPAVLQSSRQQLHREHEQSFAESKRAQDLNISPHALQEKAEEEEAEMEKKHI